MSSVVVKSVDEKGVRCSATAWAERLLAERSEVVEVIFFGSFTKGRWAPGSDLDVVVVLRHSEKRPAERVIDYLPGAFPVGVDVFAYTRREMSQLNPAFLNEIEASNWRFAR